MKTSRRSFLTTSAVAAGGVFVIGFNFRGLAQDTPGAVANENPFDAWIHIKPDNCVDLVLAQSEMGQGVYTSLPMVLADEADLDWSRVTVVQSDFSKGTGGSGSVITNYLPLRRAGAVVRTTMIAAAARKWSVSEIECATGKSEVVH
ncbi:MAG TPA: molybdopterin cofactor-binding domain-containing protein, partial [Terracidiphilus sp.]|nr:molybdopterin cofactor-binding domain-containing protein [Terracidiphilus sp.]